MSYLAKFRPSDVRIAPKLWAMLILMAIPMAVVVFLAYQQQSGQVAFAENERNGVPYASALNKLIAGGEAHRVGAAGMLNGDSSARSTVETVRADMAKQLETLKAVDRKHGKGFEAEARLKQLESDWNAAVAATDAKADFNDIMGKHDAFAESALAYIFHISNASELILDPQIDELNTILAVTISLPRLEVAVGRVTAMSEYAILGGRTSQAELSAIAAGIVLAEEHLREAVEYLDTAIADNPAYAGALKTKLETTTSETKTLLASVKANVVDAKSVTAATTRAEDAKVDEASATLLQSAEGQLLEALNDRVSSHQRSVYVSLGSAIAGILVTAAAAYFIARSITAPISRLVAAADRISLGDLNVELDIRGKNEVGQLADSLRRMQASLRSAFDRMKRRAA